jgi:hypothetical protein
MKRSLVLMFVLLAGCEQGSLVNDSLNELDAIVDELGKPSSPYTFGDNDTSTHHMPYFLDSYAVRALCKAYAVEQNPKYLAGAQAWANRVLADQARMTPWGAYYMNYAAFRQPDQTHGDWYVADSSSIAQAVLCTAHISDHPDRLRYLDSAQRFFDLVETNYINSDGGTNDGIWGNNLASWWCSTAIFGAFALAMYSETGAPMYLHRALESFDWLSAAGLATFMSEGEASVVLYGGEFYVQAWPFVRGTPREGAATKQLEFVFDWMAANQKSRNPDSPIDYTEYGQSYMAGLPYFSYTMGVSGGDKESGYLRTLLRTRNDLAADIRWALTAWAAWSESAQTPALSQSETTIR